jgi:hypothetical protein
MLIKPHRFAFHVCFSGFNSLSYFFCQGSLFLFMIFAYLHNSKQRRYTSEKFVFVLSATCALSRAHMKKKISTRRGKDLHLFLDDLDLMGVFSAESVHKFLSRNELMCIKTRPLKTFKL